MAGRGIQVFQEPANLSRISLKSTRNRATVAYRRFLAVATRKTTPKPVRSLLSNSTLIEVLCGCTHKPYPHSHAKDKGDVPWNWDETHKIWAEQKEKSRPRC